MDFSNLYRSGGPAALSPGLTAGAIRMLLRRTAARRERIRC